MISASELAIDKVKEFKQEHGYDASYFVRVSVEGGGCSGLSYRLDFDNEMKEDDQEFQQGDEKIVVDMKSYLYLHGTELQFSDGLNGKGFNFHNPNATRTCGCGESFAV
ncbi:MAG: iron-sulfur cluster assembly accessory protein [Bacteroidetes bacterium SW_10_40_5]|nr:MAG: iron-sulfur cluster assembly accessory protein [Bacteroidetes bacterium SW_10_40_5]